MLYRSNDCRPIDPLTVSETITEQVFLDWFKLWKYFLLEISLWKKKKNKIIFIIVQYCLLIMILKTRITTLKIIWKKKMLNPEIWWLYSFVITCFSRLRLSGYIISPFFFFNNSSFSNVWFLRLYKKKKNT